MKKTTLFLFIFILNVFQLPAQATWTQKADHLGAARYDFAGFAAGGNGYIGGGRYAGPFNSISEWQQFNPSTNTWSIMTPMPYPYTALSAFEVGGFGYVMNGVNDAFYDYDTYKYNHLGNNWSTLASMTYPRLYSASTANGAKGYVIGGYGFSAEALRDLWEYNPVLDLWTEKDTLPLIAARYNATAFSITGNIYVFGGWGDIGYLNDLWKYDTTSGHWAQASPLPSAGRAQSLSFVLNDEAYVVGGTSNGGNLKEVWKYNAVNDAWQQQTDFPGTNAPLLGAAFVLNGKGYIVSANGTSECWEFDPGTVNVDAVGKNEFNLSLYPNPLQTSSSLDFSGNFQAPLQVEIYNSCCEKLSSLQSNGKRLVIDRSEYKNGIYFLRVRDHASIVKTIKFVVQ